MSETRRAGMRAGMLVQDQQQLDDRAIRALIRSHPWATLVSHGDGGAIASHMPAILDEGESDRLVLLTHTARADPQRARLERGVELLVVFQGEHGFLPGAWQGGDGASVGTWNFEAAHVHGRPQVLDREGSLDLLRRTFEHLEARRARPTPWSVVEPIAERLVEGTCCVRVPADQVQAKAKLAQGKSDEVRARLIAALERPGPYRQPGLARRMRAALRGD